MKNLLVKILNFISNKLKHTANRLEADILAYSVTLSSIENDDDKMYKLFTIDNKHSLNQHDALMSIYNVLFSNTIFLEFGYHKVIMITIILPIGTKSDIDETSTAYSTNILVNNDTSMADFVARVEEYATSTFNEKDYRIDVIQTYKIKVYNMDDVNNTGHGLILN